MVGHERAATLLIVQCRDSRDMLGHYPPRCYRSHGMEQKYAEPRDWHVGDMTIPGVEYGFEQKLVGQTYRTTVYNFFVVPGGRSNNPLRRDMDAVRDAAEAYQQRYYGAAPFPVVFQGLSSGEGPTTQPARDPVATRRELDAMLELFRAGKSTTIEKEVLPRLAELGKDANAIIPQLVQMII